MVIHASLNPACRMPFTLPISRINGKRLPCILLTGEVIPLREQHLGQIEGNPGDTVAVPNRAPQLEALPEQLLSTPTILSIMQSSMHQPRPALPPGRTDRRAPRTPPHFPGRAPQPWRWDMDGHHLASQIATIPETRKQKPISA